MFFQKGGDCAPRLIVLLHSQRQRLRAAHHEPGIERRQDRTGAVLHKADPVRVFFVVQNNNAADAVGVAVEILRRRVHDDVDAEFQRALQIR